MLVYVWAAFPSLAGRFRAKIAPWVARFGRGLPSHHGVHMRGSGGLAPEAAKPRFANLIYLYCVNSGLVKLMGLFIYIGEKKSSRRGETVESAA